DHGHKETETIGSPSGTGVELETKSNRTLILKDFADYERMIDEFNLIEYPSYFLPKNYKYLLCEHNKSFGVKGNISLSHGGI
ncbi:MAG TPA: PglZ domain-containing protein, partial [Clostridiales bacterium]|nr:PglZ domain-containing protein [Clostridiales bacterium]